MTRKQLGWLLVILTTAKNACCGVFWATAAWAVLTLLEQPQPLAVAIGVGLGALLGGSFADAVIHRSRLQRAAKGPLP